MGTYVIYYVGIFDRKAMWEFQIFVVQNKKIKALHFTWYFYYTYITYKNISINFVVFRTRLLLPNAVVLHIIFSYTYKFWIFFEFARVRTITRSYDNDIIESACPCQIKVLSTYLTYIAFRIDSSLAYKREEFFLIFLHIYVTRKYTPRNSLIPTQADLLNPAPTDRTVVTVHNRRYQNL